MPTVTGSVIVNGAGPGEGGTGVTDGDKGDISVTDDGLVWTIDAGAVTPAELSFDPATQTELDAHASAESTARGAAISTETSARTAADAAETSARIAADDTLTSNLAAETSARTSADSTLSTTISGHTSAPSGAHAASAIAFTPTGTIGATNVQAALAEVAAEGGGGGSGVSDGDKGDITISSSGSVYTIDTGAVTPAKLSFDPATQTELDSEIATRVADVATLSTAISNEASARAASDSTLTTSLAGKVDDTGDTMTGNLVIDRPNSVGNPATVTLDAGALGTVGATDSDAAGFTLKLAGTSKATIRGKDFLSLGIWITELYDEINARVLVGIKHAGAGNAVTSIYDQASIRAGSGQTLPLLTLNDTANTTLASFDVAARFLAAAGAVGTPAISRLGDTNTGFYFSAADTIDTAYAGVNRMKVSTTAITTTIPVVHPNATAAAPSITGTSFTDTGIYFAQSGSTGAVLFSVAGVECMRIAQEGHVGIGGATNPQNAWICVGNGTGTLTDLTGGTAATRMGFKMKLDTVSGVTAEDGAHFSMNIVPGTLANGPCHGLLSAIELNDTSSRTATSDTVALWGGIYTNTSTQRKTWAGNFETIVASGVSYTNYTPIGVEVGIFNNAGTACPGAALNLIAAGTGGTTRTGLYISSVSTGRFVNGIVISGSSTLMPTQNAIFMGAGLGSNADTTGIDPSFAVTSDDVAGAAIMLGNRTTTPTTSPADGGAVQIYQKGSKLIFRVMVSGTVRYKYLDLTGTGVTWVYSGTAP